MFANGSLYSDASFGIQTQPNSKSTLSGNEPSYLNLFESIKSSRISMRSIGFEIMGVQQVVEKSFESTAAACSLVGLIRGNCKFSLTMSTGIWLGNSADTAGCSSYDLSLASLIKESGYLINFKFRNSQLACN